MAAKDKNNICIEILKQLGREKVSSQRQLNTLKLKVINRLGYKGKIPRNAEISTFADEKQKKAFRNLLSIKPTRTLSGVSVVAVMTKPIRCPHARKGVGPCIMCPGGPKSAFGDVPQSYTGKEPATRRALRNKFDPYMQAFNRLEQYVATGHNCEKAELIIMGGTFPSFPKKYREEFTGYCFKAMNDFGRLFFRKKVLDSKKFNNFFELPGDIGNEGRVKKVQMKMLKEKSKGSMTLEKEQKKNEKAFVRCVGLTIETRPDYASLKDADEMLRLGCTRVELGVQTIYDNILSKIKRGHTIKDSIDATRRLKNLGFKINYHIMPGLPGVSRQMDLKAFNQYFENADFRPDMLKIYPCMVLKGTKLYEMWKKGEFKPLTTAQASELIVEFKKNVPEYCRIMRVQRDIPTFMTSAGVGMTNLRQHIEKLMKEKGIKCRCIRCREIGIKGKNSKIVDLRPEIIVRRYDASGGKEFFISYEDKSNDVLLGYCRLRLPSQFLRKEITKDSALVRELHVLGESESIGNKARKGGVQHTGIGKMLLKKAEEIALENGKRKIVVISAVGTREYYKKLGYEREGFYMVNVIKQKEKGV